jgi:hypothetical protein
MSDSGQSAEKKDGRGNFWVAILGIFVALLAIGVSVYVPYTLDNAAQARERKNICTNSVIDLRLALDKVATGYVADPGSLPARLADWDSGESAIERTRVSCVDIAMPSAHTVEEVGNLWSDYYTERNSAKQGPPSLDAVTAILDWTTASIKDLTATTSN